jgi:hypothetical protein
MLTRMQYNILQASGQKVTALLHRREPVWFEIGF